jgi:hypothetical protein
VVADPVAGAKRSLRTLDNREAERGGRDARQILRVAEEGEDLLARSGQERFAVEAVHRNHEQGRRQGYCATAVEQRNTVPLGHGLKVVTTAGAPVRARAPAHLSAMG